MKPSTRSCSTTDPADGGRPAGVATRAHGAPLFDARYRSRPEHFDVSEVLGFEPAGSGEHDLLYVEKTGSNTTWLARQLARHAAVPAVDVGFAGLKDRHAVTRQWFSVRTVGSRPDWTRFDVDGVRILRCERHDRKLRRGAHRGNVFRITLTELEPRGGAATELRFAELVARIDLVRSLGVPNYFGSQRFGHDNLGLALRLFSGRRMSRDKRSIALSAARAALFNAILERRVSNGSWNRILPGELANLDGTGSVFAVSDADEALEARLAAGDIHPTATLWGRPGSYRAERDVSDLEHAVVAGHSNLAEGLAAAGLDCAQRALRIIPRGLTATLDGTVLTLAFTLQKGAYATAVLAEFGALIDASRTKPA